MYKIIFLDDELITIRMLESAIDWQKYHVAVLGTASDGEEGIELFQHVEPDIVIADIRMPKMNGIEFAHAIRQTKKKVKILLLSAYAEFEYAQSAITYQVSDYLLKPLDEDKLESAIARIVQDLDRDYTASSTIENYRLERVEKQLQQFFLRHMESSDVWGSAIVPDEILKTYGQADILIHVLRVIEPHELQMQTDVEDIRLSFKDHLGSQAAAVSICPEELIVLTTSLDLQRQMENILNVLRVQAQPVKVGISTIPQPFNLIQAHGQAENALYECFYSGEDLCFYSVTQTFSSDIAISLADFEHPIAELVEQGKSTELIDSLQDHLLELFSRRVDPSLLYEFVFDVLNWVKIALTKQYSDAPLTDLDSIDRNRIRACASKEALVAYLTLLLQTIGEAVNNLLAEDPSYYIVKRAKHYTREHYIELEFSLVDVADYVGLSKNHFSRVFHKTTGMKFWDYVTQLRIEKAKELLKKSNFSNYEICRAIGYESEFYFSKIFKTAVGVTAQQFRRL